MFSRLAGLLVAAAVATGCTMGASSEIDDDAAAGDGLREEHARAEDPAAELDVGLRVCADGATTKGIDVSKWQGTIDWPRVKADGVHYAFVRLSDGANTRDSKFAANWAGAKAAGVIRGAYQFFRPAQSVTAQADMMIAAIGSYQPGDLPPVIDVEDDGGLAPAALAARVRQWVDRVSGALGVTPIVYTGKFFWRDEVGGPASFAGNPLWLAQYTSLCPDLPPPWSRWTFWQYTDSGAVAGISGAVDINRFNGSVAQLLAFAGGTPAQPVAPLAFGWTRNADASYDFTVSPPAGVARVDLLVEHFLIGTAPVTGGSGALHYIFNVAVADRAIEARGLSATGEVVALGNGVIDSLAGTAVFMRQTAEHEYEIGFERAPASWATVEIDVDGFLLTDLESGQVRSPRRAVRWRFNGLGLRNIRMIARNAAGAVVDTRDRQLLAR